jgi:hypothetical protein
VTDNPTTLKISVAASFEGRIDRRGPNECWPWRGAKPLGYGVTNIRMDGRRRIAGAHQVAHYLATGRWEGRANGRMVRHLCHNPLCCNPAHLAGGTALDNATDRWARVMGWPLKNAAGVEVTPHPVRRIIDGAPV